MDADFNLAHFGYRATYNADLGRMETYLVSRRWQEVAVERHGPSSTGERVKFEAGEPIRTEVSYKYTLDSFAELAATAFLAVQRTWTDARGYFDVHILSSV